MPGAEAPCFFEALVVGLKPHANPGRKAKAKAKAEARAKARAKAKAKAKARARATLPAAACNSAGA